MRGGRKRLYVRGGERDYRCERREGETIGEWEEGGRERDYR